VPTERRAPAGALPLPCGSVALVADSENVALVRRTYELFNARDAEGIVALMDPEGELYPYAIDDHRAEGYRGHDGLRRYVADVVRLFDTFEVQIDDVRDAGDDVVLADGRLKGRTHTGVEIDMAAAWLWTVRDGRLTRMQAHPTPRR
jgi:ketosteroid isomerase-like protein